VTLDFKPIQEYNFGGSSEGVFFNCEMGVNCKTRAFVKIEDSVHGGYRYYVIFEVRNPSDSESKVLVCDITPDTTSKNDFQIFLNRTLEQMYKYSDDGEILRIRILTKIIKGSLKNPSNAKTYKNYPPEVQEMRDTLTFPDELSGVPLLVSEFNKAMV
jgi:hypothetical protein